MAQRTMVTLITVAAAFVILTIVNNLTNVPASAILPVEASDRIKMYLNEAIMAVQNGNTTGSEQALTQANQTIGNASYICNMPVGCDRTSTLRTDEAQPLRDSLREAINALRGGDISAAQQPLMQANQSLSSIS